MPLILIVDDSVSLRLFLAELRQDPRYEVARARDGQEALDYITTDPPDLALSDAHILRLIRLTLLQLEEARADIVPWILISGTLRHPPQEPVPFLVKPFEADNLLDLIEDLLAA